MAVIAEVENTVRKNLIRNYKRKEGLRNIPKKASVY